MAIQLPGANDYTSTLQRPGNSEAFAPTNEMGQKEFLMLLTTQMMNQDPTDPMDPTSFVTDLTQMSQLEATTQLNKSVMSRTEGFKNLQVMQAAGMVGRTVLAEGEVFSHQQDHMSQLRLSPTEPLTDVKVVITNSSGVVQELDVGSLNAGDTVKSWDGITNSGAPAASGDYKFVAYGYDANGDIQSVKTVVGTQVSSVSVEPDGSMKLTLSTGERINMNAVREIG